MSGSIVTLNVGGLIYTTARSTLTRYPDSMLGAMFCGDLDALLDDQGRYFIDRDGTLFRHVLNFLRTSQLVLPEDFKELPLLEMEADFYQIQPLIEALKSYQPCAHDVVSFKVNPQMTRRQPLYTTPYNTQVGANSKEVEDMVSGMVHTLGQTLESQYTQQYGPYYNVPCETWVAELLGKLHEIGFTVQSFGVACQESGLVCERTWVMMR